MVVILAFVLKRPSYHFLHFTRKEKNGTVFFLFIIFLLIATPFIYSLIFKEEGITNNDFKNELATLKKRSSDSGKNSQYNGYDEKDLRQPYQHYYENKDFYKSTASTLFYFDPNTLPADGWKKLGLTGKTISTIQKYLSKGGKFRQPADIKKIWGLQEEQVNQLLPYVKIEGPVSITPQHFPQYEKKTYPKKEVEILDINEADSNTYLSLPGIGPGFARRIIKFRDKLGGFYKTEQIGETFGLPDSTFQKIKGYLKISGENIKKININTASVEELKEHPYIRYQLANAIIQFRTQHGNFTSIDDMKKIMLINDETFMKISPYLTVQ